MIKKYALLLMISAILPYQMMAEWIPVDGEIATSKAPKVTLLSTDGNSTVLRIDLAGFELKDLVSDDKTYQSVDLLNDIFTTQSGYPELPYVAEVLAIPDRSGLSIEVIATGEMLTFSNFNLPPARPSWWEGEEEPGYVEYNPAYNSSDVYPAEMVKVGSPSVFRDFRIARVSVFPVRYIASTSELHVYKSVTVRVNYDKGEVVNPKTSANKPIPPSFAALYRSTILNYEQVLETRDGSREEGHELMLCIMPDEFVDSFQPYAEWNRQTGTDVVITAFSQIGANGNNPDIIKNHITDAYYNWQIPPSYVLIVGDDGIFPKKIVNYDYSFPNDDYFVEIAGNDHFPEMMIGRFTNQGDYRMRVMINKYMLYEREPYIDETDWYKHGTCCSNNAYESQVETKRFAAERMREDGGFVVDTLMSDGTWGSNCSMDEDDIIDVLNAGRSYLNYRGEGWTSGWSANCYSFHTNHVSSLNNGRKFTFVTSIGCGVTMFDAGGGNCFGEEWIQLGSLTEPRGGVAFIGPTSNTHTTYNNRIDKGIYQGMFVEGMDTPGQAMLRGKLYMFNVFGGDPWVEYHYRVYTVLGDPSLHIWKDVPLQVNVDHVTEIPVGVNQLEINVDFAASGQAADSVMVCVTGTEVFVVGYTDASGKAFIDVTPTYEDTLTVTVRGGNVYPYQSQVVVTQEEELVEPEGTPEIVDIDGNNDGLINPNENGQITITLKNWGSQTVSGIEASMSSDNPFVQVITTNPVNFGDMAPGGTVTGDPFQFFIDQNCPTGQAVSLKLTVTSTQSTWEYNFDVDVNGCHLAYTNFMVSDYGASNMNYCADPGESVDLFFSVINDGLDVAPEVMGTLTSSDPYITIDDQTASFGSLLINGSAVNTNDYFSLSIDESCPTGYMAEFSLTLFTQGGNYPYEITMNYSMPVALPVPADFTGPDTYGYYAFSSEDSFFDQTPVYDWVEIDDIGTSINIFGESDYTETVDLPFTFKYYGQDYNKLRISTDGWVAFGNGVQTAPINNVLPYNDNVNNMVAVFWDDLHNISFADGDLLYYYDDANHRFIVEWDSITRNDQGPEPIREEFQVLLLDPAHYTTTTGDGEILMQYRKMFDVAYSTIGIENNTQDIGLQYVFNDNYNPTANLISDGLAIKFTTEEPFASVTVSVDDENDFVNKNGYGLEQNHPNPFNNYTWINYSLPETGSVLLQVFDIRGKLVRTLVNDEQSSGMHSIQWKGDNTAGVSLKSGVYIVRLKTDGFTETMKMFMLK